MPTLHLSRIELDGIGNVRYLFRMSRRSIPQPKLDDQPFPVRIFIAVPEEGLRGRLQAAHLWLNEHVGAGGFALHGGGRVADAQGISDRVALYLRDPGKASAFLAAFSDLKLADGTQSATYSNPSHRPG